MHKTTIKIDGAKLRSLLEYKTGLSIYQIAVDCGYSKNVIANAVKAGYASSAVQNIARLYDIDPCEYKILEYHHEEPLSQMSFEDLEAIKREELKDLIKEAIIDLTGNKRLVAIYNPHRAYYEIYVKEA